MLDIKCSWHWVLKGTCIRAYKIETVCRFLQFQGPHWEVSCTSNYVSALHVHVLYVPKGYARMDI